MPRDDCGTAHLSIEVWIPRWWCPATTRLTPSTPPMSLSSLRAGADTVDLRTPKHAELCCGFGGAFAVEYPEISGAMLGDKLEELVATGARLVVCNEGGCALNMSGGAHRRGIPLRFKHLAECLAESLGLMEPEA